MRRREDKKWLMGEKWNSQKEREREKGRNILVCLKEENGLERNVEEVEWIR